MKVRSINIFFILIGAVVGVILLFQIKSNPIGNSSSAIGQLSIQKSLLETFSLEQENLKSSLKEVEDKINSAKSTMARRTASSTLKILNSLKSLTGFDGAEGVGVRISVNDNQSVARINFSSLSDDFVQASDLRDLANGLFVQGAHAVSLNGKRLTPLSSIDAVFDTVLVDNLQIAPPFVFEATGIQNALKEATKYIKKRNLRIYIDEVENLNIQPIENLGSSKFINLEPL